MFHWLWDHIIALFSINWHIEISIGTQHWVYITIVLIYELLCVLSKSIPESSFGNNKQQQYTKHLLKAFSKYERFIWRIIKYHSVRKLFLWNLDFHQMDWFNRQHHYIFIYLELCNHSRFEICIRKFQVKRFNYQK